MRFEVLSEQVSCKIGKVYFTRILQPHVFTHSRVTRIVSELAKLSASPLQMEFAANAQAPARQIVLPSPATLATMIIMGMSQMAASRKTRVPLSQAAPAPGVQLVRHARLSRVVLDLPT